MFFFFFSSRRRHTRYIGDWSSDVCSSDLIDTFNMNWTVVHPIDRESPLLHFTREDRSEERRVGKECSNRCEGEESKKKSPPAGGWRSAAREGGDWAR